MVRFPSRWRPLLANLFESLLRQHELLYPTFGGDRQIQPLSRTRSSVTWPGGDEVLHLRARQQMWTTKCLRGEHYPRKLLHRFHALIGRAQIRPTGHNTVIFQQDRIIVVNQRLESSAEFPRTGGSVRRQRNLAEANNHFWENRFLLRSRCRSWH